MALDVTEKELRPGAIIAARFALERPLGAGGMGVVWAAVATSEPAGGGGRVALKFLRGDRPQSARVRQRFLQEAEATRKINHPGVVQIRDVVEDDDGLPVLVMDLLEGETLASRLERAGPMPALDAVRLLLPAASAIAAAHDQRVIHRDLKPENLFLCDRGGGRSEIRVLDFGIAKVMRDGSDGPRSGLMTSTGVVLGTPFYMAPEQIFSEGEIDERADVWAFGVMLYECIAGRRPFAGPSVGQVLRSIALDEYTPLAKAAPHAPGEPVCDLVTRLLARERGRRPRTMREVERLLQTILDGVYEFSLPYAETVEISPVAHTLADRASFPAPPSSRGGRLGDLGGPDATTTTDATSKGPSSTRFGAKGMPFRMIVAAVTAILGAAAIFWPRPSPSPAPVPSTSDHAVAALAPSPPAPPVAIPPPVVTASTDATGPAIVPSSSHVAAIRPAAHPDAHPNASAPHAASAGVPSPQASAEPSRRPGSVVDVPPF